MIGFQCLSSRIASTAAPAVSVQKDWASQTRRTTKTAVWARSSGLSPSTPRIWTKLAVTQIVVRRIRTVKPRRRRLAWLETRVGASQARVAVAAEPARRLGRQKPPQPGRGKPPVHHRAEAAPGHGQRPHGRCDRAQGRRGGPLGQPGMARQCPLGEPQCRRGPHPPPSRRPGWPRPRRAHAGSGSPPQARRARPPRNRQAPARGRAPRKRARPARGAATRSTSRRLPPGPRRTVSCYPGGRARSRRPAARPASESTEARPHPRPTANQTARASLRFQGWAAISAGCIRRWRRRG